MNETTVEVKTDIQVHHINKFVDFALNYFEDEHHQKEYEAWHLENYGCLPEKC